MKTSILAALAAGTMFTSAATAGTLIVNGSTAGGPVWNRPIEGNPPVPPLSALGTAVRYQATQFSVSANGAYIFQSTATNPVNWDNYSFLYVNSFNAAAPFTNVVIGNDDNPTIGLSGFTTNLTAGFTYFFVETGFSNTDFGAYTLRIDGPGDITAAGGGGGAVPEPATWAMMIAGFGMIGGAMRTRSRKVRFA